MTLLGAALAEGTKSVISDLEELLLACAILRQARDGFWNQTWSGKHRREARQGWLGVAEGVLRWAGCPGVFLEAGTGFRRTPQGLILVVIHAEHTAVCRVFLGGQILRGAPDEH